MSKSVLVVNGPGLSDLSAYSEFHNGTLSLATIRSECEAVTRQLGLTLDFRQTDNAQELSRWIEKDGEAFDGVIVNPAGNSSAAKAFEQCRSAIRTVAKSKKPIIEVHIANIHRQVDEAGQPLHEPAGATGFVCGLGKYGYVLALQAMARKLDAGHRA